MLSPPALSPPTTGVVLWRLTGLVLTVRPHQWVKNVFVLAPIVFAKEIFEPKMLTHAAEAFVVFCLLTGAVYTLNDLADIEADRAHPLKRFRPVASGRVPVFAARVLASVLILLALGLAAMMSPAFLAVVAGYFFINILYSVKLKHLAYLDVACIATGFVLRVVGGGLATGIQVSAYLLVCTAFLALFLGFGKRRHELSAAAAKASRQRAALEGYSRTGLQVALWSTAIVTVATYLSYTLDSKTRAFFQSDWLWPSTLFVVLAVARFMFLVHNRPHAESPTQEMLRDGPFVGVVLIWTMLVMWVVYHLRPA